jgi:hypothetical protein
MELEAEVLERVGAYERSSQWEKSELGRDLRRLGLSYGEIMALIPVKKSTLATWCRDIELSEEQVEAIKERRAPQPGFRRRTNRSRLEEISELRAIARDVAGDLISDPAWVAGIVLYWAEGAKSRGHVSIANTDPRALGSLSVGFASTSIRLLGSPYISIFTKATTRQLPEDIGGTKLD